MYVKNALVDDPMTTRPTVPFRRLLRGLLATSKNKAAVLDGNGRLIGMISVHDILSRIVPLHVGLDHKLMEVIHDSYVEERLVRLEDKTVADLMSTQIDRVSLDDSLIKAVSIMVERRRKALPVVDQDRFVGLVTRRSILERVAQRSGLLSS